MVYMKKGTSPKNQQQFKKGKKAVQVKQEENDFEGMDDSDDSDEAPQLQKTPQNKGVKGRQSMSEKKVSFSIPGKNSPSVKTPKKDNSILAKKQPTPANKGKTAMQEFKGMKGKQAQEDDDDENDEDDDDFDIEDDLDLDIDDEEGDDEDDEEGDDDDEEGDDDDEDDEEEDDDEEEGGDDDEEDEDDKATIQKKLSLLKQSNAQQSKQKTLVKGNEKAKKAESPVKGLTPKKEQTDKAVKVPSQQITDEVERRRQRDSKMLYVGGLPKDTTEEELKTLSIDIVDVSLPLGNRKKGSAKTLFAFLNFNSEAKAESNYKTLQSKKFRGQPLTLDFVGFKSKNKKSEDESTLVFNLKKLFVGGLPADTTIDQLAKIFKKSFQISLNRNPSFRTATINFDNEEDAKDAYDANKEITLSGHKLPVLYSRQGGQADSRKRKNRSKKPKKNSMNNGANPAKKMKFSKPE